MVGWAGTSEVKGFMSGLGGVKSCNCSASTVSSLIAYDADYLQVEYAMVSPRGKAPHHIMHTLYLSA
jgi:hypothetical protein